MAVLRREAIAQIQPQIPEIGRIFKGAPKKLSKSGKMIFGDDLDYFRFAPDERLKDQPYGNSTLLDYLEQRWASLEQSTGGWRSLPIRFPFPTVSENFSWANEVWSSVSGKESCTRRCDGTTCTKYMSENAAGKKVVVRGAIDCAMQPDDLECPMGCKASGRLRFMMPSIGYPGMLVLTTRSGKDIKEIIANLEAYRHMDLSAIPFRLFRRLDDCDHHLPDGSIQRKKRWLMHLEIDAEFGMLAMEGRERQYRAVLSGEAVAALPTRPLRSLPAAKDDFGGDRTNPSEYHDLPKYQSFLNALRDAQSPDQVGAISEGAYKLIERGVFPTIARNGIDRECDIALDRLRDRDYAPVEVEVVEDDELPTADLEEAAGLEEIDH